jgi:prepilin-type N-terminal cleavage/methylation domain-containing protein
VFPITRTRDDGFTLVEIMVVVVLLGLIGTFVYSGISTAMGTSQRGKDKVEAVSVLQAVTEELTSSNLKSDIDKGSIAYDRDWIPNRYSVRYSVADTEYGVYRLKVEVNQGAKVLASNTTLVCK